jgi:hypothetical protein
MSENYQRLVKMAEKVFAVKNDPDQLDVNDEIIQRLQQIHPATLMQHYNEDGPVAWVLLIPTTVEIMKKFLHKQINEKELFFLTTPGDTYEALYLCSALVLEEFQHKGITTGLVLEALNTIRKDHPIQFLFVWPFTEEGNAAAEKISGLSRLPLFKRL